MNRGAWRAISHGVTRVRHDWSTKHKMTLRLLAWASGYCFSLKYRRKSKFWKKSISLIYVGVCVLGRLIGSESLWPPWGHRTARLLCPWDFSSNNTGTGCQLLLQRIFLTQGSNPHLWCLLHWQVDSLPLYHLGSPYFGELVLTVEISRWL